MIELEKISFRYQGRFPALEDVNLLIGENERVAILGATRSGKSTLVKILQGLLSPDRGRVRFFGEKPDRKEGHPARAKVGFASLDFHGASKSLTLSALSPGNT